MGVLLLVAVVGLEGAHHPPQDRQGPGEKRHVKDDERKKWGVKLDSEALEMVGLACRLALVIDRSNLRGNR
jgi:hypothetical protein